MQVNETGVDGWSSKLTSQPILGGQTPDNLQSLPGERSEKRNNSDSRAVPLNSYASSLSTTLRTASTDLPLASAFIHEDFQ